MMEGLLKALAHAEEAYNITSGLVGRRLSLDLGVVSDIEDPAGLGRVKCLVPSKGVASSTDWLQCLKPSGVTTYPIPKLGDTVPILYFDGDPNQGFFLGVVQNMVNTPQAKDSFVVSVGDSVLVVSPIGIELRYKNSQLSITDTGISINTQSMTINGKQVATIGARDSDGDVVVSKGW